MSTEETARRWNDAHVLNVVGALCVGVLLGSGVTYALLRDRIRAPELVNAGKGLPAAQPDPAPLPEPPRVQAPAVQPQPPAPQQTLPIAPKQEAAKLRPGDRCEIHFPEGFALAGKDGSLHPIARDILSLKRMLQYVEARDGKGLMDMRQAERIYFAKTNPTYATVIAVDERLGTIEVRMLSGQYIDQIPGFGPVEGMLNKEAVVPLSMARKPE